MACRSEITRLYFDGEVNGYNEAVARGSYGPIEKNTVGLISNGVLHNVRRGRISASPGAW